MVALVVLIEPYSLHAKLFTDVVRMAGHHCVTALTGREGLAIAVAVRPELVILDLVLPDCDGRDIILELRHDERTATVPIMVLTAADGPNNEFECFAFGATAFLSKPIHIADLRKQIDDTLMVEIPANLSA
jgi:DNA-binding response OmpR family regulator